MEEELFMLLMASERAEQYTAEVPAFVVEIQRILTAEEFRNYLDYLVRTKYLAPSDRIWSLTI